MTNGPAPDAIHTQQCDLNNAPDELKDLIIQDLTMSNWGNLGIISKTWQGYIIAKSQAWLNEYFPFFKINHPGAFENKPFTNLWQALNRFHTNFPLIPRSLFQPAKKANLDDIIVRLTANQPIRDIQQSLRSKKIKLYAFMLASGHSLPEAIVEECLLDEKFKDELYTKALLDGAACGNLTLVKDFAPIYKNHLRGKFLGDLLLASMTDKGSHTAIAKYLLTFEQISDNDIKNALINATKLGHDEMLKVLLEHPHQIQPLAAFRFNMGLHLILAGQRGHLAVVKRILTIKDIWANHKGEALYRASCEGYFDIVKTLLNEPDMPKSYLKKSLKAAQGHNHPKIASLLQKSLYANSRLNQALPRFAMAFKVGFALLLGVSLYLSCIGLGAFFSASISQHLLVAGASAFVAWTSQVFLKNVMLAFFGKHKIRLKPKHPLKTPKPNHPSKYAIIAKAGLALGSGLGLGLGLALCVGISYFAFSSMTLSLNLILLLAPVTLLIALCYANMMPINTKYRQAEAFENTKDWVVEQSDETFSVLSAFGHYTPYKTTVKDLEANIFKQLKKALDKKLTRLSKEQAQKFKETYDHTLETGVKPLAKLFTKKLVCEHPLSFYRGADKEVAENEFNIDENSAQIITTKQLLKLK